MSFRSLIDAADLVIQKHMGVQVIYKSENDQPIEMRLVFDSHYVLTQGTSQSGVETVGPAVFIRKSDIPESLESDDPRLTIDGIVYRVTERQPDGMGGIVLMLRRFQ